MLINAAKEGKTEDIEKYIKVRWPLILCLYLYYRVFTLTKYIYFSSIKYLQEGYDTNKLDMNGLSALIYAAHEGHKDAVLALLNGGSKVS